MGLLDLLRDKKARLAANHAAKVHADWAARVAAANELAQTAREFEGAPVPAGSGILPHKDERAYMILTEAALIEPKRLPGHWQGRNQGVSIHVMKNVNYRIGGTRGTYAQGEEETAPIDVGTIMISNQRVVFAGGKESREWLYPKVIGFQHYSDMPWTVIQVSNRQKVSGIGYNRETEDQVRFRLELALANYSGSHDEFVASIDARVAEVVAMEPLGPRAFNNPSAAAIDSPSIAPTAVAAGWYQNPDGAGQRYWNGSAWTDDTAP
jgi:hypothetical protein